VTLRCDKVTIWWNKALAGEVTYSVRFSRDLTLNATFAAGIPQEVLVQYLINAALDFKESEASSPAAPKTPGQ
jgi:hypothetical protein